MRDNNKNNYYCTNCFHDMSCKEERKWEFAGKGEIIFKDKCMKCGGEIEAGFPPVWVSRFSDYHFEGEDGTRMYAAAYLKGQEKEMRKKHPGREFRWHNNCWLPVIKNRTDKKKFLKERGYVEF